MENEEKAHHQDGEGGHQKDKTMIIVNASPYYVAAKTLTYEQVVNLAYNDAPPIGPNVVITVTYSRGENGKSGTMLPGDNVKIKKGMVFDVTATDRS